MKLSDVLAFDIGGTQGRCGIVRCDCDNGVFDILHFTALTRAPGEEGPAWFARLIEAAQKLKSEARSCAISFGGPVRPDGTLLSVHVPGWETLDIPAEIERAFGIPKSALHVENDANAGALAEHRAGAGRGVNDMLYFTVSTGIGGGVILNGKLHRGAHGLAGEFGHMILDVSADAPRHGSGKPGALEALACGPAIARDAARALQSAGLKIPQTLDAKQVFEAAGSGHPWAGEVLDSAAANLGRGMAATCCAFDVQRIVVGGGVAQAGEPFFRRLREALNRFLPNWLEGKVSIVPAELGDRAPMLGAAIALTERQINFLNTSSN